MHSQNPSHEEKSTSRLRMPANNEAEAGPCAGGSPATRGEDGGQVGGVTERSPASQKNHPPVSLTAQTQTFLASQFLTGKV